MRTENQLKKKSLKRIKKNILEYSEIDSVRHASRRAVCSTILRFSISSFYPDS